MREWPNAIVQELGSNHARRKPVAKKDEVRRVAAIQHYMRERLISRGEAEQMYAEYGLYAPHRKRRRP